MNPTQIWTGIVPGWSWDCMGIPNFVVYISTFADYLPELCLAFGMSLSFPRTIADRMRWVRVVCHCVCVCVFLLTQMLCTLMMLIYWLQSFLMLTYPLKKKLKQSQQFAQMISNSTINKPDSGISLISLSWREPFWSSTEAQPGGPASRSWIHHTSFTWHGYSTHPFRWPVNIDALAPRMSSTKTWLPTWLDGHVESVPIGWVTSHHC